MLSTFLSDPCVSHANLTCSTCVKVSEEGSAQLNDLMTDQEYKRYVDDL